MLPFAKQRWLRGPLLWSLQLFLCATLYAQVDVTKYASDDLFAVRPVVAQNYLDESAGPSIASEGKEKSFYEIEVQEALDLWSIGEHEEALFAFEQLSELYDLAYLDYYIGVVHYESDQLEEAVESFNETLANEPMFLEAKYMLGMVALEQDNLKGARVEFKALIDVPAYEAFGHYGMGQYSMAQGQPYQAVGSFKRCIEADSTFMQAYGPLVSLQLWLGKAKSARNTIETALTFNPEWQEGIMMRGMLALLSDGNFDQFEEDVNTLIAIDPANFHYLSIKGFLQMELENYHDAVLVFRDAINMEVDSVRTGEFKFSSKFRKEESLRRSLNYYFDHFDMDQSARAYLDQGICHLMSDSRNKAIQYFDSALYHEEHPVTYLFMGAACKSSFGRNQKALQAFSRSYELDSNNWVALSYRAEQHVELGDAQSAYEDYNKLVKLRPRLKEGYKNRGVILLDNGHYQLAYRDFSIAIGIDKTDYDCFFNRAIAAGSLSQHSKAQLDLEYILERKPEDGEAYYLLYQCRSSMGDSAVAISYLDSASKYCKYVDAYHQELLSRAQVHGRPDLCIKAHDRLVKYNRWEYEHLMNRGKYLYEVGEYDRACEDLRKYVKKKKDSGEAYHILASTYEHLGEEKQSERCLKKAAKLGFP